jgi:8-oxo-dGTP pyrophosphatase MutT (NUDIX family)
VERGSVRPVAVKDVAVVPVRQLDTVYERRTWAFAESRAGEISAHFGALQSKNPAMWNGRVLMLGEFSIADMVFHGSYFSVDYASFLAWRDWGFPDPNVRDCFAMGAVRASDGPFLLGVMAPSTANPGLIYFPCGTPDHDDIVSGTVDLEGSIRRELEEETGFDVGEFDARPGWVTVLAGPWIANMKLLQSREDARALRARALDHLARQKRPELADIRIVGAPADLDPMMPPHVVAYLRHMWQSDVRA